MGAESPPEIAVEPEGVTNVGNSVVVLTAVATGSEPLSYCWRREGVGLVGGGRISGADSSVLTLADVRLGDAGSYVLVVTNAFGAVTSAVATLTVSVPDAVVLPDGGLEAVVRAAIDQPAGPLDTSGLSGLTSVWVCHRGIASLSGLEWATNLARVVLCHNAVTNLAPLEGLNHLIELNVEGNRISDLSVLASLPNLEVLNAGGNEIASAEALAGLTNLSCVRLGGNGIREMSFVSGLTRLRVLELEDNPIGDLSPLGGLTNLGSLALGENPISDFSPVGGLRMLTNLSLPHAGLESLIVLRELPQLTSLNLERNRIADLTPLAGLTNLDCLNLRWNPVTHPAAALPGLTNLSVLNLGGNALSDLTFLGNLRRLTWLNLGDNTISNVAVMAGLTNLNYLVLSGNPIADGTVLSGLGGLVNLELRGGLISDLGFISSLSRLGYLDVADNQVHDLSPLALLSNLNAVVLAANRVTNYTALSALDGLSNLWLDGNAISDLTLLATLTQLTCLSLDDNHITDPSPLNALTNLDHLALSRNPITNCPVTLTRLTRFWLEEAPIADLGFLSGLPQLTTLGIRSDRISDLTAVGGLTNLVSLYADFNRLTNLAALVNLPRLSSLGLVGNLLDLSDGSPALAGIQSLQNRGVKVTYAPQDQPPTLVLRTNWVIAANATSSRTFSVLDDFDSRDQLLLTTHSSNPGLIPDPNILVSAASAGAASDLHTMAITPASDQIGTATINVTVTDRAGLITSADLNVTVQYATNIVIPDPALETVLRQVLQKPAGDLNTVDLLELIELDLGGAQVASLSGLEWALNLAVVSLDGTAVTNLDALANLTSLQMLNLNHNPILDYSVLTGLTNLTSLFLAGPTIGDLAFLQNLVELDALRISETTVVDFSPLAGLTNLTRLELTDNPVTNLTFLEPLTRLTSLGLINCRLRDIAPVSTLTNLISLGLYQNRLTDIQPLTNLVNLFLTDLRLNLLETNALTLLQPLADRGATVLYFPQREPPIVLVPPNWFVAANATSWLYFTAWHDGPADEILTLTASSADGSLEPGTHLFLERAANGKPEDWLLTLIPPNNYSGTNTLTLIATNQIGLSRSTTVALTIVPPLPLNDQVLEGTDLTWITGGSAPWYGQTNVTHDGISAAQSGSIPDHGETWLETTVEGPAILSFWWKVSSETSADWLEFYVNDVLNGTRISGEGNWTQRIVNLPAGSQTLRWRYVKDLGLGSGLDAAWLDQVVVIKDPATVITSIRVTNGVAVITWSAVAGHSYRLQYKGALTEAAWVDLFPDVPATGPTAIATNVVEDFAPRFYRILVVP